MDIKRDILDPSWMCLEGTFDQQVARLFYHVRLSKDQVEEDLRALFNDIENTLRARWPGCELRAFGSLHHGTGLKTSDVDCFLQIPAHLKPPDDALADTTRHILSLRPDIFTRLSTKTRAPVPVVKFFHRPTSRACDMIFHAPQGLSCSRLLEYLLHLDERALDLAGLVKYWAKVHEFTGPYLLKNYTLTLMVIFYLQQLGMLPNVQMLQRNACNTSWQEWNISFEESVYSNNNQLSLKELLGGFFIFFSSYNFEGTIISTFTGRSIEREHYKTVTDIPHDFVLYRDNLIKKSCEPLRLDTPMCVQDVFEHSRNCAAEVSTELAQHLKDSFKLAAKLYKTESDRSFLKAILTIRTKPLPE